MFLTLDRKQMTSMWMRLTRLEPLRTDCVITRTYGIDIEALAADEARLWYVSLLHRGPLEWLQTTELSDTSHIDVSDEGVTLLIPPVSCIRPVSVTLYGWERPAPVLPPNSRPALLATNPYSRGGIARPSAIRRPDGVIELHSPPAPGQGRLKSFIGVTDPGPDYFIFHQEALTSIPTFDGRPPLTFNFPPNRLSDGT